MNGKKITAPVVRGATQFDIVFSMNASEHNSSKVKSGTLNYSLMLAFDFN